MWVPLGLNPRACPRGSSETRKLGIWNYIGRPSGLDPRGGPRNLGNSESGIWVSLCLGPKRGPRKLGNSESGIWGSLGLGPKRGTRKLANSETRNLEFAEEYPGICTLGILESGICRGVSWNLPMRKHGIWILGSLCGPPCSHGGAPETRKLGIWNLQRSILESAHLETWNLDFGVPLQTHGGAPETRKLGIWNLLFRMWKNLGFRAARLPPPLPPLALWVTAHPSPGAPRPGRPWVNRFS